MTIVSILQLLHIHNVIGFIHHWTTEGHTTPLLTIPTAVSQQGPLMTSAGLTSWGGTTVVLKYAV